MDCLFKHYPFSEVFFKQKEVAAVSQRILFQCITGESIAEVGPDSHSFKYTEATFIF